MSWIVYSAHAAWVVPSPPLLLWLIGLPLVCSMLPPLTLFGLQDRRGGRSARNGGLAVRFGAGGAIRIAIASCLAAALMVIALQLSSLPGRWPSVAVMGMLGHSAILVVCLEKRRRNHPSPRLDGLKALALSFIVWFAVGPLFASMDNQGVPATLELADRPRIDGQLHAINQNGEPVRLSDLRGKVWAVTEFFASCPLCARSMGTDLKNLSERFAGQPDFHLVSISINPEQDDVAKLVSYAGAFGADAGNWWFLTGEREAIHHYLENDLKFPPVIERTDADQAAALGRFQHDLGILVVDRQMRIVGKRNLRWAAEQNSGLHALWEQHLYQTIENELARKSLDP